LQSNFETRVKYLLPLKMLCLPSKLGGGGGSLYECMNLVYVKFESLNAEVRNEVENLGVLVCWYSNNVRRNGT
jgi:hypothetical protein